MLEWTGERFLPFINPSVSGAEIHYEHLHRYAFAAQFVKGKRVLDLASGEGYGAFILSAHAKSVCGIEIDRRAATHARESYRKDNLRFMEGSIFDIPIKGENVFDVIVCFEVIEHLESQDLLLCEISRLLNDDGILIISTPNKKTYSDIPQYINPFHKRELYLSEFKELLRKHFKYFSLFGQNTFTGSSIYPTPSKEIFSANEFIIDWENNHFSFRSEDIKDPVYFIAIVSNVNLDESIGIKSYLIDNSNTSISLLVDQLRHQIDQTKSLENAVNEKELNLTEAGQKVRALELAIREKDSFLNEAGQKVRALELAIREKDSFLNEINSKATALEQLIQEKESDLIGTRQRITTLEQTVCDRELQITNVSSKIGYLQKEIQDKDQTISGLNAESFFQHETIEKREQELSCTRHQAKILEQTVLQRDIQIREADEKIDVLKLTLTEIEIRVRNLSEEIRLAEQSIHEKDEKISELSIEAQALVQENTALKQTISYQLILKLHNIFIEPLLSTNVNRRKSYASLLSKCRRLINKKPVNPSNINCGDREIYPKRIELLAPQDFVKEDPILIPTKVSIIIPTKDAGHELKYLIQKIRQQKGISEIEIVIVDSGSEDRTLEIAKESNCKIITIKPEIFNHGLARNLGADRASGEFLLFMVQDAIPIGNFWLYNLITTLKNDDNIGAVTCRQVPKSDADLFACFILWLHHRSLERGQDRIYSFIDDFEKLTINNKRIYAGIENTCCLIRKNIFDTFKFKDIRYGEDLELGLRLLKSRYKTAFLFTTGIVHSHNRGPDYVLKRSFIDTQILHELLDPAGKSDVSTLCLQEILENCMGLYITVTRFVNAPNLGAFKGDFRNLFMISIQKEKQKRDILNCNEIYSERESATPLELLLIQCFEQVNASHPKFDLPLEKSYCELLDYFSDFLSVYPSLENREKMLVESFYKIYSLVLGSSLACYYHGKPTTSLSGPDVAIKNILEGGV